MKRQTLTKCLKTLWGAHHFVYGSQDVADIAAVINVFPENVVKLMQSRNWDEALQFWNYTLPIGNLNIIERVWTEMIEKGEHIHLVEYPDKPIKSPPGDPDMLALLDSHLFCAYHLSDDEIRARLAEKRKLESEPVQYDGQHLPIPIYCWWIFPNYEDGIYSRVLARANMFGDLLIGRGEETCLVIIRHGRLSITRQVSDDVANVHDKRLLVCLYGVAMNEKISRAAAIEKEMLALEAELKAKVEELRAFYAEYQQRIICDGFLNAKGRDILCFGCLHKISVSL